MKCLMMMVLCLAVSGRALGQFHTISNSLGLQKDSTPPVTSVIDGVHVYVPTKGNGVRVGVDADSVKA